MGVEAAEGGEDGEPSDEKLLPMTSSLAAKSGMWKEATAGVLAGLYESRMRFNRSSSSI